MDEMKIPNNYPIGCSNDEIKSVVEHFQNLITEVHNQGRGGGTNYFSQVTEQGSAELNRRTTELLITNLKLSSKRQRQLTWAIVIIGGLNLILAAFKLFVP